MAKNKEVKLENSLIRYFKKGNMKKVKELIDNGMDINKHLDFLLYNTVYNKDYDFLYYLINKGINVNGSNGFLLTDAVLNNNLDLVKCLIENDFKDKIGLQNAVLTAIDKGYINILQYFLEVGVDINYENETPLRRAIFSNNLPTVKLLVENGANILYDNLLFSISNQAHLKDGFQVFKYLAKNGADVSANDHAFIKDASTYYHVFEVIKFLVIECNEDPSVLLKNKGNLNHETIDWIHKYEEKKLLNEILEIDLNNKSKSSKKKLKI